MRTHCLSLLAILGAAACGGDDGHDVTPTLIPGGGVTDPGIDGEVNVYVIDDDDAPIVGATVQIGDKEGVTDADGLFVVTGVSGPQTAAIKATGYSSSVWVGLDSANLTVVLDPMPAPVETPPQAELAGTITGWDALAAPPANHLTIALVSYSQTTELGDPANELQPPSSGTQIPANACVRTPAGPQPACAWRINARTGRVQAWATIIDLDNRGTPADESDDLATVTGFATGTPVTVADRANQSGLALTILAAGSTTTAQVGFGSPPAGLTETFGIVGVEIGDAGILQVGTAANATTSVVLPSLSAIAGGTYRLTAIAQEDITDGTAAQSIVLRRGLTAASAIAAGEWLPTPTGLSSDRSSVSFGHVTGAGVHILEIDTAPASGRPSRAMSVAVLDDTATVALPTAFAPLPSGPITVRAVAADVGADFDTRDFAIDDFDDLVTRISSETIKLN